ncbi:MAG: hypothetical protein SCARUB_03227 [Candidatus Scalindua rubra]|uniref:Uncharacterized protein n=1 Tax=Candidatus Scalindua rubra TaxID=1872076 RepID=A0A1E3X7N7_9BACT|nr:MAG: hypothetical protein SCARUB_03227 [Candidatus Scalindua rubra]
MVSNAFEEPGFRDYPSSPDGEPLLGMEKYINSDPVIKNLFDNPYVNIVCISKEVSYLLR